MAITERVILTVNGNVDEWKEPLQFMLETLKAQDGHLRTRYTIPTSRSIPNALTNH